MPNIKALQFIAPGEARLIEMDAPPPPGPGQLAIRMLASSMCRSPELHCFHGGHRLHYPLTPGPGASGQMVRCRHYGIQSRRPGGRRRCGQRSGTTRSG